MSYFFFFNDTATTEIYTLSLHDALPICIQRHSPEEVTMYAPQFDYYRAGSVSEAAGLLKKYPGAKVLEERSEEHTSELQSRLHLVCRLLLEKKKGSPRKSRNRPMRHFCT